MMTIRSGSLSQARRPNNSIPPQRPHVVTVDSKQRCENCKNIQPSSTQNHPQLAIPKDASFSRSVRGGMAITSLALTGGAVLAAVEMALGVPSCCIVPTMVGHLESVGATAVNLTVGPGLPQQVAAFLALRKPTIETPRAGCESKDGADG